jgi:hypothetical protein
VSDELGFALLGTLFGAYLFFGFKAGYMPTYLTGGANREKDPVLFWAATVVMVIGLVGSVFGLIASQRS